MCHTTHPYVTSLPDSRARAPALSPHIYKSKSTERERDTNTLTQRDRERQRHAHTLWGGYGQWDRLNYRSLL